MKEVVLQIQYGVHATPFGSCFVAIMGSDICAVALLDKAGEKKAVAQLGLKWPEVRLVKDIKATKIFANKIFKPGKQHTPYNLILKGTDFQMKVWEALIAIPKGRTTTYAQIARQIGRPKAVRAVGTACGKNDIAVLVPCHRVLASNGGKGGYRWGLERKKELLESETLH